MINSTPHPMRLGHRNAGGEVVVTKTIEPTAEAVAALKAHAEEELMGNLPSGEKLIKTSFVPTPEGMEYLKGLEAGTVVMASMITQAAYSGLVPDIHIVGFVPVPGLERVPPAQKVGRDDCFTVA